MPVSQLDPIHGFNAVSSATVIPKRLGTIEHSKLAATGVRKQVPEMHCGRWSSNLCPEYGSLCSSYNLMAGLMRPECGCGSQGRNSRMVTPHLLESDQSLSVDTLKQRELCDEDVGLQGVCVFCKQ
jgi:hypothetical protein